MKKQEVINAINGAQDALQSNFPSIYHRNDVTIILQNLKLQIDELWKEDEPLPTPTTEIDVRGIVNYTLEYAKNELLDNTSSWDWDEICSADLDSAEFSLNYNNQVELDACNIDSSSCARNVDAEIQEHFNRLTAETILHEFDSVNGTQLYLTLPTTSNQ
jgi:hypothetical protein